MSRAVFVIRASAMLRALVAACRIGIGIKAAAAAEPVAVVPASVPPTTVLAPTSDAAPAVAGASDVFDAAEFDLRDLAVPTPDLGGRTSRGRPDDPFDVLGIPGIEARAVNDALAALLGAAVPSPDDRVTDRRRTPTDAMPVPIATDREDQPAAALFDHLHEEFMRVVRDPTRLAGRAGRAGRAGSLASDGVRASTLDELAREAASFPLLLDILRSRRPIDRVMENFDPLDHAPPPDAVFGPDVLHLFAPEIARGARAPLADLTRREHHAVSPDSPMRAGAGTGVTRLDEGQPT